MTDAEWAAGVRKVTGQMQTGYYAPEELVAALAAAGAKIVPVKATPRMLDAAEEDEGTWRKMPWPQDRLRAHWDAMIAAAPPITPPND